MIRNCRCSSDPSFLSMHNNLEQLLYYESGLLGVSGISNDMRELAASDDPHAEEAIDLFVYRIGRELGLPLADLVKFTGTHDTFAVC